MRDAVTRIIRLEHRVMLRKRLLCLQDGLAQALIAGGLIAAGLVVLVRLRPLQVPVWIAVIAALSISLVAATGRWLFKGASERDAAFLIDASLDLGDRVATSHLIIEREGPTHAFEEAVIDDTCTRLGDHQAAEVVPFSMRPWHGLSLVSLLVLAAALLFTPRSLSMTESMAERADLDSAAQELERTAVEVEQSAPPDTETARLANEQARLGRDFRRSTATRADALRRLSALEDRIRQRHDDLTNTRADEIVSLADRKLGGALATLSKPQAEKIEPDKGKLATSADAPAGDSTQGPAKTTKAPAPGNAPEPTGSAQEKARRQIKPNSPGGVEPQNRPQEPVSGTGAQPKSDGVASIRPTPKPPAASGEPGTSADQKPVQQTDIDNKSEAESAAAKKTSEQKDGEQPGSDQSTNALNALKPASTSIAEQAAKALPKLSEELLKKAAQLRANELSPSDIDKLRKAAESLSGELAQIAQSKDLQRALQEMARQVTPEQIEQVARELGGQEKLKQELESAVRLLMENQQAKQMVAGLASQFARTRDETRQRNQNQSERQGGKSDFGTGQSSVGDRGSQNNQKDNPKAAGSPRSRFDASADKKLTGQGRESSLQGKLGPGSGGEYLYLQSNAGTGVARAPYSSAYPQYRREAERSVQRTQVPPNLRSVVRKYFDAINPDAKR